MEVFFSLRISKYVFPLLQCTVDTTTESLFLSGSELPEGIESSDSRIPQLSCDHTSQSFLTTLLKSPLSLSFFFLVHLSIPAFLSHSSALSLCLCLHPSLWFSGAAQLEWICSGRSLQLSSAVQPSADYSARSGGQRQHLIGHRSESGTVD